jgi:hypothetical protein
MDFMGGFARSILPGSVKNPDKWLAKKGAVTAFARQNLNGFVWGF